MGFTVFVTGTDTDIGKTYLSACLAETLSVYGKEQGRDLKVKYFKAAVSGADSTEESDAGFVIRKAALQQSFSEASPYLFKEPLSPHFAAEREGKTVQKSVIKAHYASVCNTSDITVFEGTGGLFCPLGREDGKLFTVLDVMREISAEGQGHKKIILVGPSLLGAINHICNSYNTLRHSGFTGSDIIIVMNRFDHNNAMHVNNLLTVKELCRESAVFCAAERENAAGVFSSAEFLSELFAGTKY